jgi:hypothetical protein
MVTRGCAITRDCSQSAIPRAHGQRVADRLDATGRATRLLALLVGGQPWTGRRDVESRVRGGAESDASHASGATELIARSRSSLVQSE